MNEIENFSKILEICRNKWYSFNLDYSESSNDFELTVRDYWEEVYYNKRCWLCDYVVEEFTLINNK